MLPIIKKGFTLIELLVAVAIMGIISIIGVNLVWNTVTSRSKQYSIENSSENLRTIIDNLSKSIQSGGTVNIASNTKIQISGSTCLDLRYDATGYRLLQSTICNPTYPNDFNQITNSFIQITTFQLSPVQNFPQVVNLTIVGKYKDNLGEHPINYTTSIAPRVII